MTAAETSLHPLAFCPAHKGENSPLPRLSALARKGAMADVAKGKAGTAALMGPSSLMMRFTMPRAGRPVNRLVSAVTRGCFARQGRAMHGAGGASGHNR